MPNIITILWGQTTVLVPWEGRETVPVVWHSFNFGAHRTSAGEDTCSAAVGANLHGFIASAFFLGRRNLPNFPPGHLQIPEEGNSPFCLLSATFSCLFLRPAVSEPCAAPLPSQPHLKSQSDPCGGERCKPQRHRAAVWSGRSSHGAAWGHPEERGMHTHPEHRHWQAGGPSGRGGDPQNRERCDICEALPLMSLFDEFSNAAFIFLSPGARGRLQKSLVLCRFPGCRFAPVLLPAARGDGDWVRQSPAEMRGVFCFKNRTCRWDEATGGLIRWFISLSNQGSVASRVTGPLAMLYETMWAFPTEVQLHWISLVCFNDATLHQCLFLAITSKIFAAQEQELHVSCSGNK